MYKVGDIVRVTSFNSGGQIGEVGIVVQAKDSAEDCLVRFKSGTESFEYKPYVVLSNEQVESVVK